MSEEKPRPRPRARKKPVPVGILLVLLAFLFLASTGVFFLGLRWRSEVRDYRMQEKRWEHIHMNLDFTRDRLEVLERLSRNTPLPQEDIVGMAEYLSSETLPEVLNFLPDNEEAHRLMGRAYEMQYQSNAALASYSRAIRALPDSSEAYYYRGILRFRQQIRHGMIVPLNQDDPAFVATVEDLRQFVTFWPDWKRKYITDGMVTCLLGNYKEADTQVKGALGFDSGEWRAHFVRALCQIGLKKDQQALQSLSWIRNRYPYVAETHALRGQLLQKKGAHDKALQAFSEAITIDPFFSEAYVLRSRLQEERNNKEAAKKDLDQALQLRPDLKALLNPTQD